MSMITLLLFAGATGKSAADPLYVWLPARWRGRRRFGADPRRDVVTAACT